jgi:hypothetical protein
MHTSRSNSLSFDVSVSLESFSEEIESEDDAETRKLVI